jgi:L-alanine-DL-glutamate epimerase-like enolase superfamily enzyme
MAADSLKWPGFKLLKVKLGEKQGDVERIEAIRKARPDARLICDANEGWSAEQLKAFAAPLAELGVEMIEQPLPSAMDEALRGLDLPLKICADESCHVAADVEKLVGKYKLVNVKLDKAGGITGALELIAAAKRQGMEIMVGCMLGTSLAMAPGLLAGQHAAYVDLDGPLALSRDREPAMSFNAGMVSPAPPELWG